MRHNFSNQRDRQDPCSHGTCILVGVGTDSKEKIISGFETCSADNQIGSCPKEYPRNALSQGRPEVTPEMRQE